MKTTEIHDEENSIDIDDEYDTTNIKLYSNEKRITIRRSVKNDCFYSYETIEYKISARPIELHVRTLEKYTEPPKEWSIKDGVALEAALRKQGEASTRIESLKKQVEWSKVELFDRNNYKVYLYILSRHPEIISYEEYRRFLRQTVERIENGSSKIAGCLNELDSTGLQVLSGSYGKQIWYPDDKEISEEKRATIFEYIEKKINDPLFNKDSKHYTGITKEEFQSGSEILEYIASLLDKEVAPAIREKRATPQQYDYSNKIVTALVYLLTLFIIVLKLTDGVDWSWFAIISPALIWQGFGFIVGFLKAPGR